MQFMVRVEMHHATEEMYENLHRRMAAEALSRFLVHSSTGQQHHMPTGTYWTESYATSEAVMAAAIRASTAVDREAMITVSGGSGPIRFYNCPLVAENSLANIGALLTALTGPKPASTVPIPEGLDLWVSLLKAK